MELKVWVEGVQRVVCGVSEQTSCQDVVIALAQAIGQTGRYVLIQTLRDKERQLLPHERPLEFLAKSGQYANDVHFILKRTGPSLAERPSSDIVTMPPERTFVRSSLPHNPRTASTEVTRSKEPKKSLTFNLGTIGSSDVLAKHKQKQQNGLAVKEDIPKRQPSKEEMFKMVLRQQEQLKSLEMQNGSLGKDLQTWERGMAGTPQEEEDEIAFLERLIRRNEAELSEEMFWVDELQRERAEEQERQDKMRKLRTTMDEYTMKIKELSERTEALEREIQKETSKRLAAEPSPAELAEMVTRMRKELETKIGHGQQLESNLSNVEKACEEAKRNLQAKNQELEELNKDLRQCNLQQFILQTGSTMTNAQLRPDEEPPPEPHEAQWQGQQRNSGRSRGTSRLSSPDHSQSSTGSPPQFTEPFGIQKKS